jgi:hypothetical protein
MNIPIGVTSSVSSNQNFDPLDTIQYAQQSNFEIVQIFLYEEILKQKTLADKLFSSLKQTQLNQLFFHTLQDLNGAVISQDYQNTLLDHMRRFSEFPFMFGFDEHEELEITLETIEKLSALAHIMPYLENNFKTHGEKNYERNIKKFLAIFSLANIQTLTVKPLLNIAAFFNDDEMPKESALQWCCQIFNFFSDKSIPITLCLTDINEVQKDRKVPCPIGEGAIPYDKIFDFINKTETPIDGIIFHYTDKINPLKSRDNLKKILND